MRRLAALVLVAACNDPAPPNTDPSASLDDLTPGCVVLEQPAKFESSLELVPAVRGTLDGWDPEGRWFLTDTAIPGVSSVHLERAGSRVRIDRSDALTASVNDTELFARAELKDRDGDTNILAYRISNLRDDGSLRAERATCSDGQCVVCTARMVRATHNAEEGEGDGLTLLGELANPSWGPGHSFNVRVAGTLAYLIRQDGLHIIETADPAHPVELGSYLRSGVGYPNDVKLVEAAGRRYALLANTPVDVVDVTDPTAPVLVAQILESAHTLFTETRAGTTLAYLGNYDGNCPVYDVTNPAQPRQLGSYASGGTLIHDLSVVEGIAYLNAWELGLLVVDFNSPTAPTLLAQWKSKPTTTSHSNWTMTVGNRRIALHGDEGYDAHLDVVDIDPQSPAFMTSIASWQTRPWISIHNVMVFGTKAYLTHYQDGVRVLDLADPVHPTQVGYYNTWDPQSETATSAFYQGAVGLDVDVARKLVFVADSPRGLIILRDDTP